MSQSFLPLGVYGRVLLWKQRGCFLPITLPPNVKVAKILRKWLFIIYWPNLCLAYWLPCFICNMSFTLPNSLWKADSLFTDERRKDQRWIGFLKVPLPVNDSIKIQTPISFQRSYSLPPSLNSPSKRSIWGTYTLNIYSSILCLFNNVY